MALAPTAADASRVYAAIFGAQAPALVVERFVRGAGELWGDASPQERRELAYAFSDIRDLEALELASRRKPALPLLLKCFVLMMYVGETAPESEASLVNTRARPVLAFVSLGWSTFRTIYKILVGGFALRRVQRKALSAEEPSNA